MFRPEHAHDPAPRSLRVPRGHDALLLPDPPVRPQQALDFYHESGRDRHDAEPVHVRSGHRVRARRRDQRVRPCVYIAAVVLYQVVDPQVLGDCKSFFFLFRQLATPFFPIQCFNILEEMCSFGTNVLTGFLAIQRAAWVCVVFGSVVMGISVLQAGAKIIRSESWIVPSVNSFVNTILIDAIRRGRGTHVLTKVQKA